MTDTISPEKRSWVMSRVASKNTSPEKRVRSMLHKMGFRFRIHSSKLPGKPDIVLPKYSLVIFVHGCFWHCHPGCPANRLPKSNVEFWENKFKRNIERDRENRKALLALGWRVETVWECETKKNEVLERRINEIFSLPAANYHDSGESVLGKVAESGKGKGAYEVASRKGKGRGQRSHSDR